MGDENSSKNITFGKKRKILFIIVAFGLTVAMAAGGVFEESIKPVWSLVWLAVGFDAAAIGCIASMIFHKKAEQKGDMFIIFITVAILTMIVGLPSMLLTMIAVSWGGLVGLLFLVAFTLPLFITSLICLICMFAIRIYGNK